MDLADGTIVTGVRYGLASNGMRLSLDEYDSQSTVNGGAPVSPTRSSAYSYDSVGRLVQEKVSDRTGSAVRTTDYAYDKVGNRSKRTDNTAAGTQTTTYTYDANDRLTVESKTTVNGTVQALYSWGDNGNLLSKTDGSGSTFYDWSADNRLIDVKQGASLATAQVVARYVYDVSGNRVSKITPNQSGPDTLTSYLVDVTFPYAQVIEEAVTVGAATSSTQYVWGNSLIQQTRAGQGTFYHADGLGSIKALTSDSGVVTDDYHYDAFGTAENISVGGNQRYGFAGEYGDDTTGLQYNRARWYDTAYGRFVSADTFDGHTAEPLSLNKYTYVQADPVNHTDPSGLVTLPELSIAEDAEAEMQTISVNTGKSVLKKVGCEHLVIHNSACQHPHFS